MRMSSPADIGDKKAKITQRGSNVKTFVPTSFRRNYPISERYIAVMASLFVLDAKNGSVCER